MDRLGGSVSFEYDGEHGCVVITCVGQFDAAETSVFYERLADVMAEYACTRCLCDVRAAQVNLDPVTTVVGADKYLNLGLSRSWKRAMLVNQPMPRQAAFWETAMLNRGHLVKVLTDRDAALTWLTA